MAGIEVRNGRYNIIVRYGGKRFVRSLKTDDEDQAMSRKHASKRISVLSRVADYRSPTGPMSSRFFCLTAS